jgi:hypothetical protein
MSRPAWALLGAKLVFATTNLYATLTQDHGIMVTSIMGITLVTVAQWKLRLDGSRWVKAVLER